MGKMRVGVVLCFVFIAVVMVPADELKDLSSADVAAPALSNKAESKVATEEEESDLGESTGFGGGLVTSGSFSMMVSSSMEEEEGELGESTGFGGGLVTSGSFSMMASSSMERRSRAL